MCSSLRILWENAQRLFTEAERVARSIPDSYGQAKALVTLAQAQHPENAQRLLAQAEQIAHNIQDFYGRVELLVSLVDALINHHCIPQALSLVQRYWFILETREQALAFFPLVCGFVPHTPSLGMELFEAFEWVGTFLRGT